MNSLNRLVPVGLTLAVAIGAGCRTNEEFQRHVTVLPVKPSVFVRATFDSDATHLVGAFLPDELEDGEVDESAAARTRCSEFIKVRRIPAQGEFEEVMSASSGVSGKLGVKSIAHLEGGRSTSQALRAKYALVEKLIAEPDTRGLAECCAASPVDCPGRYISSVIMADGQIYAATEEANSGGASGSGSMKGVPVDGEVLYKDGLKWERKVAFKHQYFAFSIQRSRFKESAEALAKKEAADARCDWARSVPRSIDGQYFVGISPPAPTESIANDLAMRNAREQVIKYLGEYLSTSQSSTQTVSGDMAALEASLEDQKVVEALSEGVARMVKDEKWCAPQVVETPKGALSVVKVLAFFPNEVRNAAAKNALVNLIALRKKDGNLTPEQEQALQAMIDGIK